jgi:uncharacterized protein YrrD
MLILRSKIVGATIVDMRTQSRIGVVCDLVLATGDPHIAGILAKNGRLSAIARAEILGIDKGFVVVHDEEALCDIKENLNMKKLINAGFKGIGQKMVTKSGKKIGRVDDLLINSQNLQIAKYYVRNLFSERIISAESVVEIEAKKIIIKDDYEMVKASSPAIETSVI